jgi:hypothetical protein
MSVAELFCLCDLLRRPSNPEGADGKIHPSLSAPTLPAFKQVGVSPAIARVQVVRDSIDMDARFSTLRSRDQLLNQSYKWSGSRC